MDPALGNQGLPGMTPRVDQTSRKFLTENNHVVRRGIKIPSTAVDSGNTPTTKLRAGLALVRVEAAGANLGTYVPVGHADAPVAADIEAAVLLMEDINMLGPDGAAEAKTATGLIHGFVDSTKVIFGTVDVPTIDAIKTVALPLVQFENPA